MVFGTSVRTNEHGGLPSWTGTYAFGHWYLLSLFHTFLGMQYAEPDQLRLIRIKTVACRGGAILKPTSVGLNCIKRSFTCSSQPRLICVCEISAVAVPRLAHTSLLPLRFDVHG
jgi:hypothetical protein